MNTTSEAIPLDGMVPIREFCAARGLTQEKTIQMINDGFYSGRQYENKWYIHRSELDSTEKNDASSETADAYNSEQVKNRIKIRSLLLSIIGYGYVFLLVTELFGYYWEVSLMILVGYIVVSVAAAYFLFKKALRESFSSALRFKKNFAFSKLGESVGEFQHIFFSEDDLLEDCREGISKSINSKTPLGPLRKVEISDIDKGLRKTDAREFYKTSSAVTGRGSQITLMLQTSKFSKVLSVKWWVLLRGYIDYDKQFRFFAAAPVFLPLWIIPHLLNSYDLVKWRRTIYPSFYNDNDVILMVRGIHDTVFNALVDFLESKNIDTSDLKAQRSQVMNITISGGKTKIGSIVQGAVNKVVPGAKGAKA